MPPTLFFSSRLESDEDPDVSDESDEDMTEVEQQRRDETWNKREIKDCSDLLQLSKSALPTMTLGVHYRSEYRELIAFSNAAFYQDQLNVPVRHPDDEIRRIRPIQVMRADGVYENQTNDSEAALVTNALRDYWSQAPEERPSIGVVTFNRKQADLIEEHLERRAEQDAVFRDALARERERLDDKNEDMSFFVKNVENVQGDERDVIIFSSLRSARTAKVRSADFLVF